MPITLTRSILVILLPGALTAAPFMFYVLYSNPEYLAWYKEHENEAYFFVFSFAVIIGSIYEGISSLVEVKLDNRLRTSFPNIEQEWYDYLCHQYSPEPVAFRYMSRRATTMYFEFSMAYAMPIIGIGSYINLARVDYFQNWYEGLPVVFLFVALAYYFFRQAMENHLVLSRVRYELYKRYNSSEKS